MINAISYRPAIWTAFETLSNFRETRPGQATASCPGPSHKHGDRHPSLSIGSKDDGKVVFHCHAGCDAGDVLDALEATWRDCWPSGSPSGEQRFVVKDRIGKVRGVQRRYYDYNGEKHTPWIDHVAGAKQMPLYGAEKLTELPSGSVVYLVEGPVACEALWKRNVPAVGTMTGASATPCDDSLRDLRKFIVTLWPDNDDAGHSHMKRIAQRFQALGIDHRWFDWPDAPPKADAADYFAYGGAVQDLETHIRDERNEKDEKSNCLDCQGAS